MPMPLDQMILDWKILDDAEFRASYAANDPDAAKHADAVGKNAAQTNAQDTPATIRSKKQKFLKILLTAAPKDLVGRYIEIFKTAGLNLVSLETESFAAERALIGKDPSPIMMIDIGAVATTISIVVDGVPVINRSIDVAGHAITKALAQGLRLDTQRAEQF